MSVPEPAAPLSAFHSHEGLVRRVNEDGFLDRPDAGVWLVADGMGGAAHGDVASTSVVAAMADAPLGGDLDSRVHRTIEVLTRVNADLRGMARRNGDDRMIATTVACLLGFDDGRCVCVWAGDSRIYRWRRGELTRLTRDHSQVQEMIDGRALDPAQAAGHRLRNVITRAVGAQDDLDLDQRLEGVESGDVFLLCSDGLHTLVSDPELAALLGRGSPAELARVLVHLAVARGAPDNVTVGVVQP